MKLWISLLCVFCLAGTAGGELIVWDPFDGTTEDPPPNGMYDLDVTLHQQDPGIHYHPFTGEGEGGWSSLWNHCTMWFPEAGTLNYSNGGAFLKTGGDKIVYGPGDNTNFSNRFFRSGGDQITEGSVYLSMLAQWNTFEGNHSIGLTDQYSLHPGKHLIQVNSSGLRITVPGDPRPYSDYVPLTAGETYFLVARLDIDDSFHVYVNPDLSTPEDQLQEGDYLYKIDLDIPAGEPAHPVNIFANAPAVISETHEAMADEIRIGTTWDDVVVANLIGDFDGNGAVNGLDIPDFKEALADPNLWAENNPDLPHPDLLGDFDGNGAFNGLDIPGFKDTLAGTAVPEPATLMLALLGAAAALRRNRR